MMRKVRIPLLVGVLFFSSVLIVPQSKAAFSSDTWWESYGNYQSYFPPAPQNISSTTIVYSSNYHYWAKVALVVSVYQYELHVDTDARVNFRIALYFDSFRDPDYGQNCAAADAVTFNIEKDSSGSDLTHQTIEYEKSVTRKGYHQGCGLNQYVGTASSESDRSFWGLDALASAVGLVSEPVEIALYLLNLGHAFDTDMYDYDDASFQDTLAQAYWHNPGFDWGGLNPVRQYAFNTWTWTQDYGVEPSTFYGIKISAHVAAQNPLPEIDTPPVYLRIYPNSPPNTPSTPSGPIWGVMAKHAYTYSTSTTDPEGDNVCYQFDWGDSSTTTTGWNGSGQLASASHTWASSLPSRYFYLKVRAQDVHGKWSNWSPYLAVYMSIGYGGGGCPYVSVWNGTDYILDNNLIPTAENSDADVVDNYLLQQPLVKQNGKYSLLIWDLDKHSYLDRVQLLAVDHDEGTNIALTPKGEILTYKKPLPPVTAVSSNGTNVLSSLTAVDGISFEGYAGDYVILDFGNASIRKGAKLVLRSDECLPKCATSVHIQVKNSTGGWTEVEGFIPRSYMSTDIIDLSGYLPDADGILKVRVHFTSYHKIDYIGLDTTNQKEFETHEATMISATHSNMTDVNVVLQNSDNLHVELWPGESVIVNFNLPDTTWEKRDYIIILEGHYYIIN